MTSANDSRPSSSDGRLQCCCGRPECAYLENNNTILGGIERDLETAARLGQALLNRHESYVSESRQEHDRLTTYINTLENERISLRTSNDKIVEENRLLLHQLEAANTSLTDSDSHVKGLEALLRDCEVEVKRLNNLCQRTEELEIKILELEKDRMTISTQADDAREETRSTFKRWRESETNVRQLEKEAQRIEWDARKDRERHEELIARLERERALERELGGAEGRLKGAEALRGLNGKEKGTTVVSHFVRDILQDNANLQAGIVELRDLLQTSNEEVQNLRDQVLEHQPMDDGEAQASTTSVPLSDQIDWSQSPSKVQQSVHVHHHYHAKLAKRERTPTARRSSRRRTGLGMLLSTPESSAPPTPTVGPRRFVSSPVLPAGLHQPQPVRNRWSIQSSATASSMASSFPSSPKSYFEQPSSIFDMLEIGEESSRPTSPESAVFATSPAKFTLSPLQDRLLDHQDEDEKYADDIPERDENTDPYEFGDLHRQTLTDKSSSQELTPKPSQILVADDTIDGFIPPEPPDLASTSSLMHRISDTGLPEIIVEADTMRYPDPQGQTTDADISTSPTTYEDVKDVIRPGLRRTASHDSLVSISGMDIHIAKRLTSTTARSPSLLKGNKSYFALSPSAARRMPSAQPLATVTEYTALSSTRSFSSSSSTTPSAELSLPPRSVSSSVAALSGLASMPSSQPSGFTRLVGGWARGRWGIAPMKSSADLRSSAASTSISSSTETQGTPSFAFPGGRMPGINQKGPIQGLRAPPRITAVQVKMVNEAGLKEMLAE